MSEDNEIMSKDNEDLVFSSDFESFVYKVIVIGDPAVGKTSLLKKFSTKQFSERYLPTVGVNILKEQVNVNNKEINLMLWDVASQPQFYMLHMSAFCILAE